MTSSLLAPPAATWVPDFFYAIYAPAPTPEDLPVPVDAFAPILDPPGAPLPGPFPYIPFYNWFEGLLAPPI